MRAVGATWEGLVRGIELLVRLDPGVLEVVWLTLRVCGQSTFFSVLVGVPLGAFLAFRRFLGRGLVISVVNTLMGIPPTVAGLWVSFLLWRSGPLGRLELIYTPTAIVIAQVVIAVPLVTGLSMAAFQQLPPKLPAQVLALGASPAQLFWTLLKEARLGLLAAVIAGFGGVVSEVGASMMVGGNILHHTRVLTTAIVMEVGRGNFAMAWALSFILLGLTFTVTAVLTVLQQGRRRYGGWP